MASHELRCVHCGRTFTAGYAAALTCSGPCRNGRHRATMRARRARLAADADAAARTGDITALRAVARATASLLAA